MTALLREGGFTFGKVEEIQKRIERIVDLVR